jgi:hypothetical protein
MPKDYFGERIAKNYDQLAADITIEVGRQPSPFVCRVVRHFSTLSVVGSSPTRGRSPIP